VPSKLTTGLIKSVAAVPALASGGVAHVVFHDVVLTVLAMIVAAAATVCVTALVGSPGFLNNLLKHREEYRRVRDEGKRLKKDAQTRAEAYRDGAAARTNLYNQLGEMTTLPTGDAEDRAPVRAMAFEWLTEVNRQANYHTPLITGPSARTSSAHWDTNELPEATGNVVTGQPDTTNNGPRSDPVSDHSDQVAAADAPSLAENGSGFDVGNVAVEGETLASDI
jgi:hypothetical protein